MIIVDRFMKLSLKDKSNMVYLKAKRTIQEGVKQGEMYIYLQADY